MTKREMIIEMLNAYGAMTSNQIAVQINNKKGVSLTPSQVAGTLRPLIAKGEVANSKDEHGKTRYWMVKEW